MASAALPRSTTIRSSVLAARMASYMPSLPVSVGAVSHVTFNCCAARTASHSFSATTPTKSPLRKTRAPGMFADGRFVQRHHLRARAICALATRANHAAMQHSGHAHVLHVDVFAADLVGQVVARNRRADKFVFGGRLHRRRAGERQMKRFVADQFAVADRSARRRNNSLRYRQTDPPARPASSTQAAAAPAAPRPRPCEPAGRLVEWTRWNTSRPDWA